MRTGARRFELELGSTEHYEDAPLYDHEYRRRRADVTFYRILARDLGADDVLELGCGSARLALALARDGRRVVGIDRSQAMLARARARLAARGARVAARAQLVRADLRDFALRRRFPLVICAFNTFQHLYTRDDVARCLARVAGHLAPGGVFALDVMNPDLEWLARDPTRRWARTKFRHPETGERLVYSTNHAYDRVEQINYIRIYYEPADGAEGTRRTIRLAHRMFFPEELLALLDRAGFAVRARHGGFGDFPLESESEQQVLITELISPARRKI
jgi:SAM-dependent methyltransferase